MNKKEEEFLKAHTPTTFTPPACPYCGSTNEPMVSDHIIPKALGGTNETSNLHDVCWRCNAAKGALPEAEFEEWLDQVARFRNGRAKRS